VDPRRAITIKSFLVLFVKKECLSSFSSTANRFAQTVPVAGSEKTHPGSAAPA
jgi:hypothetical protein